MTFTADTPDRRAVTGGGLEPLSLETETSGSGVSDVYDDGPSLGRTPSSRPRPEP